jgi:hypothetical protein
MAASPHICVLGGLFLSMLGLHGKLMSRVHDYRSLLDLVLNWFDTLYAANLYHQH